jgi:hypothetical protein
VRKTCERLGLAALIAVSFITQHKGAEPNITYADERAKWVKTEMPLTIYHHESRALNAGYASAEGFWQSTSSSKDKQLVSPVAVKIECTRDDKTCKESEATVLLGVLKADLLEYTITSWTEDGIAADDNDEGSCGIGHRLSLDYKSNSVTVTDYPKKVTTSQDCKPFQDANSYSLRGGGLMLIPPAIWDPLAKPAGK